jgi:hypothetical protein
MIVSVKSILILELIKIKLIYKKVSMIQIVVLSIKVIMVFRILIEKINYNVLLIINNIQLNNKK